MPNSASSSSSGTALPDEIVQAISIANAKCIGEQPAILANLALANQIFNDNLQQQMLIANQQAMNQIIMATVAKCVSLIATADTSDPKSLAQLQELIATLKSPNPPTGGPA